MQLAERADRTSTAAAVLFVMPFAVSVGTGGTDQVMPYQSTGNTVLIPRYEGDGVEANAVTAEFAARLRALMSTYGLQKKQLASLLDVSRPTLNGWLNQSVETIRRGNQDRLADLEQVLERFVPVEDAALLGPLLQRELEEESAKLLTALNASQLDTDLLRQVFAPIADALDGMRRSQQLDSLLGENKAPFI